MTEQEKELLIKNYCARLPYGLKLNFYARATNENVLCTLLGIEPESDKPIIAKTDNGSFTFTQDHVKPYLRPLSTMTQEERDEWGEIIYQPLIKLEQYDYEGLGVERAPYCFAESNANAFEWMLKKQFDYDHLIEKGLALEAPEGMYEHKSE